MKKIKSCEVCGGSDLESVLDLGLHPLCDDLVEVNDPRVCKEYPIEILYCDSCKTAHQKFQVPKVELFPKNYHYRSRFTADVLKGMSNLANEVENQLTTLTDKLVLDIGCNDGSLLDFFQKKGAKTIGIEPTDAYIDGMKKGHDIKNIFFTPESAKEIVEQHGSPDVITFTNVFAHIENLPEVLEALKILMSPATMIVIENHYLGSVLDRNQFDTFYHEHPRTYSLTSFNYIAENLGVKLKSVGFPSRYGGNIRIFMGGDNSFSKVRDDKISAILKAESKFSGRLKNLNKFIKDWQQETKAKIQILFKENGKLAAKAFPGRAAILIKLLGLNADVIDSVYEKPGSLKIGHYLPGTRIPIVSDDELFLKMKESQTILNLAWHIPDEIEQYLRENKFMGSVVNIIGDKICEGD